MRRIRETERPGNRECANPQVGPRSRSPIDGFPFEGVGSRVGKVHLREPIRGIAVIVAFLVDDPDISIRVPAYGETIRQSFLFSSEAGFSPA